MDEIQDAYKTYVGKPEEKWPRGRAKYRREINAEINFDKFV